MVQGGRGRLRESELNCASTETIEKTDAFAFRHCYTWYSSWIPWWRVIMSSRTSTHSQQLRIIRLWTGWKKFTAFSLTSEWNLENDLRIGFTSISCPFHRYKKNLKAFYIVHPTFWTKMMTWWFTTFMAPAIKHKVHSLPGVEHLYSVICKDQLEIPAYIRWVSWHLKCRLILITLIVFFPPQWIRYGHERSPLLPTLQQQRICILISAAIVHQLITDTCGEVFRFVAEIFFFRSC